MFGKIAPRTFMLMHIGINNQTFRRDGGGFKQQVFFHDAWVEFEAAKKGHLSIGAGLLYWNGISRMTNASTITFMSLDSPIFTWPTIELTDQFARQMGLYAKGKAGLFDYRVSVTRPFARTTYNPTTPGFTPPAPGATGNYNPTANTFAYSGYFQFQFLDIESNVLPFTVGTYIGAKKVFNWGFGGHAQPIGIWYADGARSRPESERCSSPRRTCSSTSRSRRKMAEQPPGTARTTIRTSDPTTSETSAS